MGLTFDLEAAGCLAPPGGRRLCSTTMDGHALLGEIAFYATLSYDGGPRQVVDAGRGLPQEELAVMGFVNHPPALVFVNRPPTPAPWRTCPDCARHTWRCPAHCLTIEVIGEVVVIGRGMIVGGAAIVDGRVICDEAVNVPWHTVGR